MDSALVLGSTGFLGKEIVKKLVNKGFIVHGVDKVSSSQLKKHFEFIESDISEFIKSKNYDLSEYKIIIDAATVLPFKNNKKKLMDQNIQTARHLVKSKFNEKVSIVYISSSGIYGIPKKVPIDLETPYSPLDYYGKSKLEAEKILKETISESCLSIIRPKAILGTERGGIFEIFFKLVKKNIPIPLPSYGMQIMQFVDVQDVARLAIHLAENKVSGIWPAAAPNPTTLGKYIESLEVSIKRKIRTLKLNSFLFQLIGNLLVNLKIINFTKWHFGGYSHSSFYDKNWKPDDFNYKYSSKETFFRTADYHLEFDRNL